jgi:hypothetical protein
MRRAPLALLLAASALPALPALAADAPAPANPFEAELRADAASRPAYAMFADDGNSLTVYGFAQFRYVANFRDEESVGDSDDFTHGFQTRRIRFGVKGNVYEKNLTYDILGEFSRSTGQFILLDAFGQYKWESGVSLKWGQFKPPFLREENVSDTRQLTVERSDMNTVFSQNRAQGVQLGYETERFRGMVEFSDGFNTLNTDFVDAPEADYAITARGEFRFGEGDFKRFDDFTSWQGNDFGALLGIAAHTQAGGDTGGTADVDFSALTADFSLEGNGWNAYIEAVWRHTEPPVGDDTDDFGVLAQAGIFVSEQVELFGRYDAIFVDDTNGDDFNTLTGGLNYYVSPKSHAAKFSADVLYHFDDEAGNALVNQNTGTGLLRDSEDGQILFRLQMLVMF